jgi:hypothetical protein
MLSIVLAGALPRIRCIYWRGDALFIVAVRWRVDDPLLEALEEAGLGVGMSA